MAYTDEQLEEIILRHFHGFTKEQWAELKNSSPYCEILPILRDAAQPIEDKEEPTEKIFNNIVNTQAALISDYKYLLANFTTCPQVIIDNPSFVQGKKPTEKDMEWAREKIKEYEAHS